MENKNNIITLVNRILLNSNRPVIIVSGIHGDEPAGNVVAELFRGTQGVKIISGINNTGHRRLHGKDINRHFDTADQGELQGMLLNQILENNPKLVISLHEDDEVDAVYSYASPSIKSIVEGILSSLELPLAETSHGDSADSGVISKGKQPFKGTLEKALTKRGIPYCTIETPSNWDLKVRTQTQQKIVSGLLEALKHQGYHSSLLA
jgi:hypothetical protein